MLVVVSGPSGAGKSYAVDILERDMAAKRVVPWTARSPRVGERPGIDYHFGTSEQLTRISNAGAAGYWVYPLGGSTLFGYTDEIDAAALASELHVAQAAASIAMSLRAKHDSLVLAVFMDFATPAAFEERLLARIASATEREKRRALADAERESARNFDVRVIGDNATESVDTVRRLVSNWISSEHK